MRALLAGALLLSSVTAIDSINSLSNHVSTSLAHRGPASATPPGLKSFPRMTALSKVRGGARDGGVVSRAAIALVTEFGLLIGIVAAFETISFKLPSNLAVTSQVGNNFVTLEAR